MTVVFIDYLIKPLVYTHNRDDTLQSKRRVIFLENSYGVHFFPPRLPNSDMFLWHASSDFVMEPVTLPGSRSVLTSTNDYSD